MDPAAVPEYTADRVQQGSADTGAEFPFKVAFRPFGWYSRDLEIDFNQLSRPHLITQLLACCAVGKAGAEINQDLWWDMPVSRRISSLWSIVALEEPSRLSLRLRCRRRHCREEIEIEISAQEIIAFAASHSDQAVCHIRIGDSRISLRRPNGRDQLTWQQGFYQDAAAATAAMIQTLRTDPMAAAGTGDQLPENWIKAAGKALQEFDPVVNFRLKTRCPYCHTLLYHEINLEEMAVVELQRRQFRLIETIHLLAKRYNWSEHQILAIPPWRRLNYLALLAREEKS